MKKLLFLLPVTYHRIFGRLPFQAKPGKVQFANIGEGTEDLGVKTYIADAATSYRYLIYTRGTDADHSAIGSLNCVGLGVSEDQADAGLPVAISLFGVKPGLIRVVTDGTISDGDYVKAGATGYATKATTGDAGIFGIACIGTETTKAAGDVIAVQHMTPAKYSF